MPRLPAAAVNFHSFKPCRGGPFGGLLYWQADSETISIDGTGTFAGGAWYEPNGQDCSSAGELGTRYLMDVTVGALSYGIVKMSFLVK
jgi:hypothetical protein